MRAYDSDCLIAISVSLSFIYGLRESGKEREIQTVGLLDLSDDFGACFDLLPWKAVNLLYPFSQCSTLKYPVSISLLVLTCFSLFLINDYITH